MIRLVADRAAPCSGAAVNDLQLSIAAVVAHAPEWLRRDLLSDDKPRRIAAEEALAAMIADAVAKIERE